MLKKVAKTKLKRRQAFTLTELIVVLVILAVISASLTAALTGYIKRAKKTKHIEVAEAYRVSMQATASEYYGIYGTELVGTTDGTQTPNLRWDSNPKVNNTDTDKHWGEKILELAGADRSTEPYIMVFGVAEENDKGVNPYEVVYVGYLADESSPSWFYVNGKWTNDYPKNTGDVVKQNNHNYLRMSNGDLVPIHFFVVSNKTETKNEIWIESAGGKNTLEGHSAGHNGY